ncbi:hypothetical protein [Halostagnicola kamekurae]|nr:hypothetical protein [Halostagnicola kamekurae]
MSPPNVEVDVRYRLTDLEDTSFNGRKELHFTSETTVEPLR